MNIEFVIVGFVLLVAAIYCGTAVYRKIVGISDSSGCGKNCGCD